MTVAPNGQLPHHLLLPEPELIFSAGERPASHVHPLVGLLNFGPFSAPPSGGPVRVATISMAGHQTQLRQFLGRLRDKHDASDRKAYLPPFPGFAAVTGVDLVPAAGCHIDLPPDTPGEGPDGQRRLAEAVGRAVDRLATRRDHWDVIVLLLPDCWERWRESSDGAFQLHDLIKATAAPLGCPIQMLRQSSALRYPHVASLAWRLSIALLVKAGGVPWRVRPVTREETAYIGLAYAVRGGGDGQLVTCCSQVLDSQGGGMEFVAYNVGAARDLDNPHLTREEMRAVMARSASLYQHRHAGRLPRRVSVHKTTRWRADEVAGVVDAWSAAKHVECVTVQRSLWRGVVLERGDHGSRPADWPVARGTMQQLSGTSALLWANATAQRMSLRGGRYNPNVKSLPSPLHLVRDAGHGPLGTTAQDVLALSALDWNNDAPFDAEPVTIAYSRRLSQTIARVPTLPDSVYQYRLFM
ncbi:hypothetical protein MF406_13695 [Georgenia sp. TF02-10]|uniref:argonaute/piwi family protein n=1 Tax=Georgenia sp. TF02-10 TaxID=2917725 RepID=UPI001FA7973B|nr:hypothetical protein [Georgenia sp. TF02-10]UNX54000.1 hypothetical protein MF406_13695 [Georgenia sp. TF02-10]